MYLENIKFLFAKKVYTENASKAKERVDAIIDLKDIKENGLIEYGGGYFGRVVKWDKRTSASRTSNSRIST